MASNKPPAVAQVHAAIACLRRLTDAFTRRRQALAASVDLTEGQWGVLEEIATQHFMPSMFARHRASSAAAVSKTLRQLKGKGLVTVALSKNDGRQRDYVLTAKGARLLATLREERELAIEKIWATLPPAAIEAFVTFGNQLAGRLEHYGNQEPKQE
jgi:DNA-binding MarR family transcriptional regulator